MTKLLAESDFCEIEQLFNDCKNMRYLMQGYLEESQVNAEEKDMLTNVGYIMALIDAMQLYKERMQIYHEI